MILRVILSYFIHFYFERLEFMQEEPLNELC